MRNFGIMSTFQSLARPKAAGGSPLPKWVNAYSRITYIMGVVR